MSVYFMRRASGEGPIKIGCSVAPECRRKQIGSDLKAEMTLLAIAPGSFRDERRLHRQFAADRVKSEWFNPSPSLLAAVATVTRTGKLPPAIEEDREIVFARRYLNGETLEQIAADFNITRERVRQILRRAGVPSLGHRHTKANWCQARRETAKVLQLASEGKSCSEIAKAVGDNRQNVYLCLKRAGITAQRPQRPRLPKTIIAAAQAAKLYRDGVKTAEIARTLGIVAPCLYRLLRMEGVEPSRGKMNSLDGAAMLASYRAGMSQRQIAEAHDCHPKSVSKVLRRNGVVLSRAEAESRRIAAVRQANSRRAANRLAA